MDHNINRGKAGAIRAAIANGLLHQTGAISLVDLDCLGARAANLIQAFPDHFRHGYAVKANYYTTVLAELRRAGMCAEVAGPGELALAMQAGYSGADIVFDAPVKTREELIKALTIGAHINVDNFQELEIIAALRNSIRSSSVIGLRINPQIGAGDIALSSTATDHSKFGIGLNDPGNREMITGAFHGFPWLTALHVHVGSVGCSLPLMCRGVGDTVALAEEINESIGAVQIHTIDIGGGLPVDFSRDDDTPTFADYAELLTRSIPELASGKYRGITEFGRAVVAKCAMTIARVEYTKTMGGRHIALTHAGAHNLMRVVFQPEAWARRVTALDARGIPKSGDLVDQDIAGPCCFAGDIIAHERPLPRLEPGDHVVIQDTGAYCFSNHFQYNAMTTDAVYGYRRSESNDYSFDVVSNQQTTDQLLTMFSRGM